MGGGNRAAFCSPFMSPHGPEAGFMRLIDKNALLLVPILSVEITLSRNYLQRYDVPTRLPEGQSHTLCKQNARYVRRSADEDKKGHDLVFFRKKKRAHHGYLP